MKIVVLLKEVPDTYGERKLSLETGLADRAASDAVPDESGERALEVALAYADAAEDIEVVVLTVGPRSAEETLRKGLAMGAHSAVHVLDDSLAGADISLTAEALVAALRRIGFDLVLAGNISTDGNAGVIPAWVAERLGVPHLTNLSALEIASGSVAGTRVVVGGIAQVSAPLPAVVSITEALPDARVPTFIGIKTARRKPLETWTLSDLAVDPQDPGKPRSIVIAVSERPPRAAGINIVDDGEAAARLADFLVERHLV